jgi:hypothetical protein
MRVALFHSAGGVARGRVCIGEISGQVDAVRHAIQYSGPCERDGCPGLRTNRNPARR